MNDNDSNIIVDKIANHWIKTSEDDSFNLNTRYDDYKREFYSICTFEYAINWIEKIRILRTWIKEML